MPLDKARGEVFEGYEGRPFVVIPTAIIADMNRVLVPYLQPGKFRAQEAVRPMYEDARSRAIEAFATKGLHAPLPRDESAELIQLYPKECELVFVFARIINGTEYFTDPIVYPLPPEVFNQIVAAAKRALLN